jgi:hypothetical protein
MKNLADCRVLLVDDAMANLAIRKLKACAALRAFVNFVNLRI